MAIFRLTGITGRKSRRFEIRDSNQKFMVLTEKELKKLQKKHKVVTDF